MGHVVLLGDSIFDNARYVPDRPPLVEQLRRSLPRGWTATLLAVDGHVAEDVARQMACLPSDATHLVVSVGGNDALGEAVVLRDPARTVGEALATMHGVLTRFRKTYHDMLRTLLACGKPAAVCTIYDAIPGLPAAERTALAGFNEVILREAFAARLPVVDLRLTCDRPSDYTPLSPIEPSVTGGAKIAGAIADLVAACDSGRRRSTIYA